MRLRKDRPMETRARHKNDTGYHLISMNAILSEEKAMLPLLVFYFL